jgi:hypothetical protein
MSRRGKLLAQGKPSSQVVFGMIDFGGATLVSHRRRDQLGGDLL